MFSYLPESFLCFYLAGYADDSMVFRFDLKMWRLKMVAIPSDMALVFFAEMCCNVFFLLAIFFPWWWVLEDIL